MAKPPINESIFIWDEDYYDQPRFKGTPDCSQAYMSGLFALVLIVIGLFVFN